MLSIYRFSFFNIVEKFASEVADRGFLAPMNILWMRQIEAGNLDQADDGIMKKYLTETPTVMFHHTLRTARERNDVDIVKNLLTGLKCSKVSERDVGSVHSCLIDIYSSLGKYEEALTAIDDAIRDVCLENIARATLLRVKTGSEAEGKKFPHNITNGKKVNATDSSSSSSSSSDDEPPTKK